MNTQNTTISEQNKKVTIMNRRQFTSKALIGWIRYKLQRYRCRKTMKRLKAGDTFTDKELIYASTKRCSCGAGLTYPRYGYVFKGYWDCSKILLGTANSNIQHTHILPLNFCNVKPIALVGFDHLATLSHRK